jgi:hypothetical protein
LVGWLSGSPGTDLAELTPRAPAALAVAFFMAAMVAGGCAPSEEASPATSPSAEASPLLTSGRSEEEGGDLAQFEGELSRTEDGCLRVERDDELLAAVWPEGYVFHENDATVRNARGEVVAEVGQDLEGVGGGRWDDSQDRCGDVDATWVFTSVSRQE